MKKKIIIVLAIVMLVAVSAVSLIGCQEKLTFANTVKFKLSDVERVDIVKENDGTYNVIKTVSAESVFLAFADTKFSKTVDEKFESDWNVNKLMTINFYLKGVSGYYSIVLNNGMRAMDGFDAKSKTGFYSAGNIEDLLAKLYNVFYAK